MKEYIEFLKDKMAISRQTGFEVNPDELTLSLYPHVKDTVRWAISGGCRAIFSSFGMQKTVTQLEILRVVLKHKGGKGLIVCPKRVVVEFLTQAEQHLHMKVTYVRAMADVMICPTDIMVTNYERVRDGEDGVRIDLPTSPQHHWMKRAYYVVSVPRPIRSSFPCLRMFPTALSPPPRHRPTDIRN